MVFASLEFLTLFLPLFMLVYALSPARGRNLVLLLGSWFFYGWLSPLFLLLHVVLTVIAWAGGLAVDPMFRSVAQCAGRNVIACLLTGMGKDGAQGMLEIRQAGGYTVAQNEATCVVYGMPREAVAIGGAEDILPLGEIAEALLQQARKRGGGNRV